MNGIQRTEGHALRARGLDVVITDVETNGRRETEAQLERPPDQGNPSTLRELALRPIADAVDEKAASQRAREGLGPGANRRPSCSRWYAVYVETSSERGDRINPRDAEALQQSLELAETLGATVVRVRKSLTRSARSRAATRRPQGGRPTSR